MSSPHTLALLSDRAEDVTFFTELANKQSFRFVHCKGWNELISVLTEHPMASVVWDADEAGAQDNASPRNFNAVRDVLTAQKNKENVFALTDKIASNYPALCEKNKRDEYIFQHNLIRKYRGPAAAVYGRLVVASTNEVQNALPLAHYFPEGTKIRTILIKHSDHRKTACEAVQNILSKEGLNARIAAKVAQATDELLMNAIFDAPRDRSGNQTRNSMERKASFELSAHETVTLELATTPEYLGINVSDRFGSATPDIVSKFLTQNFQDKDYQAKKFSQGAGLGLYGIAQSGISYLIDCQPKVRTNAIILLANEGSYKDFKEHFNFTSCFYRK